MLDSGANVDLAPEHILNLYICIIVAKEVLKRKPKIALINIGTEESKGRPKIEKLLNY